MARSVRRLPGEFPPKSVRVGKKAAWLAGKAVPSAFGAGATVGRFRGTSDDGCCGAWRGLVPKSVLIRDCHQGGGCPSTNARRSVSLQTTSGKESLER